MSILCKECEYGKIEYRKPNIPEVIGLLGSMGLKSSDLSNGLDGMNDLVFLSKMMQSMGSLIVSVDCKIGDEEIKDFKRALTKMELMAPISEIAGDLISSFNVGAEKKPV
jgi:hypothetical protein